MKKFYNYIAEMAKEKQENLMENWVNARIGNYRWEDMVAAIKAHAAL